MPKKKLTKSQVKRIIKSQCTGFYNLMIDKMGYPDSHVGMSINKLLEIHKGCTALLKRMK